MSCRYYGDIAFLAQAFEQGNYFLTGGQVKVAGRLVSHDERRAWGDRPGDGPRSQDIISRRTLGGSGPDYLGAGLRAGRIGSVINIVDVDAVNELQRIAVEESRLGIPLLVARDVIHGFRTVMPIPLGQAASWNPDLVREGAAVAAREAATTGVNWMWVEPSSSRRKR